MISLVSAAKRLKTHHMAVYWAIMRHNLPCHKMNGRLAIDKSFVPFIRNVIPGGKNYISSVNAIEDRFRVSRGA